MSSPVGTVQVDANHLERGAVYAHRSHCSLLERRDGGGSDGSLAFVPLSQLSALRLVLADSGG
jgi:hypothetical protein